MLQSPSDIHDDEYGENEDYEDDVSEETSLLTYYDQTKATLKRVAPYVVCAVIGVHWSSDFRDMFTNVTGSALSFHSHTTRVVDEWWGNISSPSMSNMLVPVMSDMSFGPIMFISHVTISMVLAQYTYDRLGKIRKWICSNQMERAAIPYIAPEERKTTLQCRVDEMKPVGQFEVAVIQHGWKKIKKTRKNGSRNGRRTTHRFITPLGEELSGKKAARQYLQIMSELP